MPFTPFASRSSMMRLLFRGRTVSRNSELDLDIRNLFRGFLSSFTCDGPELGRVIGHESELVLCPAAASLFVPGEAGSLQTASASSNVQTQAEISRMDFSGRIGFLDT